MKRLLVLGGAAVAVLLALRHPAPPPAIASVPAEARPASGHLRQGHSLPIASDAAVVYVVGAVAHPGLYTLRSGSRVNDAVQHAGGLRSDADPAAVNLAERVNDGDEIHVLRLGETAPSAHRRTTRKRKTRTAHTRPAVAIDLNAADEYALAQVPGIGATLASRIVEFRRLNGPFASLDELADVAGMTDRRIDALAEYVTVRRTIP